jgi:hypothetical protein
VILALLASVSAMLTVLMVIYFVYRHDHTTLCSPSPSNGTPQ